MKKIDRLSTLMLVLGFFLTACSAAQSPTPPAIVATPIPTNTAIPPTATPVPPTTVPTATPVPPTITPMPTPTATVPPLPTATPLPAKDDLVAWKFISEPPTQGRWIDVNLNDGFVRLMEGRKLVKALPAAWGYGVTGTESDYFSTAPGRYFIYSRYDYRWYDGTYSRTYINSFVGFDPERANGFHSFLYDARGNVVDNRLGAISHGCIRVEDWKTVYDFTAIGMPVMVHSTQPLNPVPANEPDYSSYVKP
jgi:L,D-transpeptidase catalytic domain